jgi:ribonuclease Z
VNAPFGDPGLLIEILWERRSLLFDMGDLGPIRPAKLLKVSHAFVSHTHIDHFIGFDTLLRLMLNREKTLKVFGPPGFLANVQGKLAGYTWNLTAEYPFSLQAVEVYPDRILTKIFRCQERFAAGEQKEEVFQGTLEEDPQLRIQAVHLDHLVPCLGFALQERFHINVHKERLIQMGLPVGPWLKELKSALWRGEKGKFYLQVPTEGRGGIRSKRISLDALKKCLTISPGQKIVYVSDCRYSEDNSEKVVQLAKGADLFYCEAAFLEKDHGQAAEKAHLTARQAGELARKAEVKKLIIFHFSPRYEKEAQLLYQEAEEAFQGRPQSHIG